MYGYFWYNLWEVIIDRRKMKFDFDKFISILENSVKANSLCSRNLRNVKLRLKVWRFKNFDFHPILREIKNGKISISKIEFFNITRDSEL